MPYKPKERVTEDDYPEKNNPRTPWAEWGPQAQAEFLKEAIGGELYDWITEVNDEAKL